ncbi:DME family drug/metabolite transporter [Actinomadura pelletieri DSM 43383]|uniref:DME family drug/metabolite transporter n=1 Tax=Actinomadura pelletieri DSM 43383 TaxID=1120940 RepID=A0A495QNQ9_9ACTN|nr:EamA family transporter [Actinomadura pelletieri]RKS74618.1 DME family drug/metabolite transporter [Actinomadura pelletieri DSM 43383]
MSQHTAARARRGGLHILFAASLWGTTGTVRTFADGSSAFSVAAIRVVVGGLVLFALAAASRRGAGLRHLFRDRRNVPLVGAGAVTIALYQTAFFVAAGRTGVAIATVVTIGSAPAFTGAIGLVVRRSAPGGRWALATAGAVAGCALLVGGGRDAGADPAGIALALLSGLSYAVYATVASVLITRGEEDRAVAGALFGAAAVPLVPVLLTQPTGWLATAPGALIALYLGVVTTGGGYLLFARGLRTTPATTATTLTLAEPAVAAVLGIALLDERLGPIALGGLGLVAVSLVVLVAPVRRRKAAERAQPGNKLV